MLTLLGAVGDDGMMLVGASTGHLVSLGMVLLLSYNGAVVVSLHSLLLLEEQLHLQLLSQPPPPSLRALAAFDVARGRHHRPGRGGGRRRGPFRRRSGLLLVLVSRSHHEDGLAVLWNLGRIRQVVLDAAVDEQGLVVVFAWNAWTESRRGGRR